MRVNVAVIGGGPAGMSAAAAAKRAGAGKVLIIEREPRLGGILEQCIHNGFGLHRFGEELTGPEYGERYEKIVEELDVSVMLNTMVMDISGDRVITAVNREQGYFTIEADAVVLAMGCREKPRGALTIAGTRPAGVYTAGTAQKLVNIKGYMPGRKVVILGSGDIGLIMARRMTLEGAEVKAVCEIMEDSGGLTRNIVQCLDDFGILLKLRHTVTEVHGKKRVEGVTISRVDENLKPIAGTEEYIECDTLMLSVGLIPENELSKKAGADINPATKGPVVDINRQTSVPGIFACGNVVKVHELVDFVSEEGETAGRAAAFFAQGKELPAAAKEPMQHNEQKKGVKNLYTEGMERVVICTICPMGCRISVTEETELQTGNKLYHTSGNNCRRGEIYALAEITAPVRTLTTTMSASDGSMISVKTDRPVPKNVIKKCLDEINCKTLMLPIEQGNIIIENVGGTGANVICTRSSAETSLKK